MPLDLPANPISDTLGKKETKTIENKIIDKVYQAKVIWYNWVQTVRDDASAFNNFIMSALSEATPYDISNHIVDVSFSKSLSNGAGNFSLTLTNSRDWVRVMRPGTWLTIYLTGDGDLPLPNENTKNNGVLGSLEAPKQLTNVVSSASTQLGPSYTNPTLDLPSRPAKADLKKMQKRLRAVCFIERVGVKYSTGPNGELDLSYQVTGKDFGVCLEETELWFNTISDTEKSKFLNIAGSQISILGTVRNLTELMNKWFEAFMLPDKFFKTPTNLKQWLLPKQMLEDLEIRTSGDGYFGEIKDLRVFSGSAFENNQPNPLAALEGFAWETLKRLSVPEFHELFTELNDDNKPRLYFRPIPWGIDQSRYSTLSQTVDTYLSLAEGGLASSINKAAGDALLNPPSSASELVAGVADTLSTLSETRENSLNLGPEDFIDYDVGPDFHSRYNQFLVSHSSDAIRMQTALSIFTKEQFDPLRPFPFRNKESIQRWGLKPKHLSISAFRTKAGGFGASGQLSGAPDFDFLKQVNELALDYWGHQQSLYSGFFTITGNNKVRLGKVIVTKQNVHGIGNMVFYIEGYTDTFMVDQSTGAGDWKQGVLITRGIEINDLKTKSGFNKKEPTKTIGSFVETPKKGNK